MSTIGSLHFTAAVSCLNLILIPTAYYSHMETQNHICCKRNYTLLFFYILEELITYQEVAYPLEKQEFTPTNKTKNNKLLTGTRSENSNVGTNKIIWKLLIFFHAIWWSFYVILAPISELGSSQLWGDSHPHLTCSWSKLVMLMMDSLWLISTI